MGEGWKEYASTELLEGPHWFRGAVFIEAWSEANIVEYWRALLTLTSEQTQSKLRGDFFGFHSKSEAGKIA